MNRINDMLEKHKINNAKDELNAMKEIIQEIVLEKKKIFSINQPKYLFLT